MNENDKNNGSDGDEIKSLATVGETEEDSVIRSVGHSLGHSLGRTLGSELHASYGYWRRWQAEKEAIREGKPIPDAITHSEVEMAEHALQVPPLQRTWSDLAAIANHDPQAGTAAWLALVDAARTDLESGWAAAKVVEAEHTQPMERARFIARRQLLMEDWKPRGAVERELIDMMVQAKTMYDRWTGILRQRTEEAMGEADQRRGQRDSQGKGWTWSGDYLPPRINRAEAIEEASREQGRWHRQYLQNQRALRDLRRYAAPQVVVNHGGQANFGARQINLSTDSLAESNSDPTSLHYLNPEA